MIFGIYIATVVMAVALFGWLFYETALTEPITVSVFLSGILALAVCFIPIGNFMLTMAIFLGMYGDPICQWIYNRKIWDKVLWGPIRKD